MDKRHRIEMIDTEINLLGGMYWGASDWEAHKVLEYTVGLIKERRQLVDEIGDPSLQLDQYGTAA